MSKYVYAFAEGNKDLKDLLGGKGANLAEMTEWAFPSRPGSSSPPRPAASSSTPDPSPRSCRRRSTSTCAALEYERGRDASATRTTRCSSPSGPVPKFSMPGMMETVLDIGLNDGR